MTPLDWTFWGVLVGSYVLGLVLPVLVHPLMVRPLQYLLSRLQVATAVVYLLVLTFG